MKKRRYTTSRIYTGDGTKQYVTRTVCNIERIPTNEFTPTVNDSPWQYAVVGTITLKGLQEVVWGYSDRLDLEHRAWFWLKNPWLIQTTWKEPPPEHKHDPARDLTQDNLNRMGADLLTRISGRATLEPSPEVEASIRTNFAKTNALLAQVDMDEVLLEKDFIDNIQAHRVRIIVPGPPPTPGHDWKPRRFTRRDRHGIKREIHTVECEKCGLRSRLFMYAGDYKFGCIHCSWDGRGDCFPPTALQDYITSSAFTLRRVVSGYYEVRHNLGDINIEIFHRTRRDGYEFDEWCLEANAYHIGKIDTYDTLKDAKAALTELMQDADWRKRLTNEEIDTNEF